MYALYICTMKSSLCMYYTFVQRREVYVCTIHLFNGEYSIYVRYICTMESSLCTIYLYNVE